MVGRFSSCTAALCILLARVGPCAAQTANRPLPPQSPPAQQTPHTLSPLHAFLGIDPVTGEFNSPSATPPKMARPTAAPPGGQPQAKSAASSSDPAAETSPGESPLRDILSKASESGEMPAGDTPIGDTTVDELRAAIVKAIDERDDHALTAALTKVTRGIGYDELPIPAAKYGDLITVALLLYPLGIALGAIYSAWKGRRQHVRTERDRRHDARQFRRRLALALSTAATIGLFWWAGEYNFWWSEPKKLLAAAGGLTLLVLVSAALRWIISRSANDYARRTLEDLRCQHAALCDEVKELRRRFQGDGIAQNI